MISYPGQYFVIYVDPVFTCPLSKVHANSLVLVRDSDSIGKGERGGDGGGQGDQDQEDGGGGEGCQAHLLPSCCRKTASKLVASSLFEPKNISQHLMF